MKTFGAPLLLATLSLAGLIVALLDDGLFDTLAALALAVPLLTLAWARCRAA